MWLFYVKVSTEKEHSVQHFFGSVTPNAGFSRRWFSRQCSQAYWWLLGWCLCIHPSIQPSIHASIHLMPFDAFPSKFRNCFCWRLQVSCCLQGRAWAPVADPRMSVSLLGQAEPLQINSWKMKLSFGWPIFRGSYASFRECIYTVIGCI